MRNGHFISGIGMTSGLGPSSGAQREKTPLGSGSSLGLTHQKRRKGAARGGLSLEFRGACVGLCSPREQSPSGLLRAQRNCASPRVRSLSVSAFLCALGTSASICVPAGPFPPEKVRNRTTVNLGVQF
jgi:hypothetical protein